MTVSIVCAHVVLVTVASKSLAPFLSPGTAGPTTAPVAQAIPNDSEHKKRKAEEKKEKKLKKKLKQQQKEEKAAKKAAKEASAAAPKEASAKSPKSPSTRSPAQEVWSGPPDEAIPGGWPDGWTKKLFERPTGKTKGTKDRYWYSPKTQKKFRSMIEVNRFMDALKQANGDEDRAWKIFKGKV